MAKKITARDLLDELIRSGRPPSADSESDSPQQFARQLKNTTDQAQREKMLSDAGVDTLANGVLALLIGARGGRSTHPTLLEVGGPAALGELAFQTYKDWCNESDEPQSSAPGMPFGKLKGEAATRRSQLLLKALVAAAFADGHITPREHEEIESCVDAMNASEELQQFIGAELKSPATPDLIGMLVDEPVAACEVFLLSAALIETAFAADRAYLDRLGRSLALPGGLALRLEQASEQQ